MTKTPSDEFKSAWEKASEWQIDLSPAEKQLRQSQLDKCSRTLHRVRDELHKFPNVVATGISMKFKNSQVLDLPCIAINVIKKIPNMKEGAIPANIDGCPTDIVETGRERVLSNFIRHECPLRPGSSIKHIRRRPNTLGGAFGCLVRDLSHESKMRSLFHKSPFSDILILSNNHVIADSNLGNIGDPILAFFSRPHHSAYLERFWPLLPRPFVNEIDAAVAKPIVPVDPFILGIGIPKGVRHPSLYEKVKFTGANSGTTTGVVTKLDKEVEAGPFPQLGGTLYFKHCIETTANSLPGDSGSLLLDDNGTPSDPKNNNGIGLEFAGINNISTHCELQRVLNLLNVELVTTSNWPFPE